VRFKISIEIEYMELLSQYNHKSTYGVVVNSLQPKVEVPGSNPFGLRVFGRGEGGDGANKRAGRRYKGTNKLGGR
jgi:hypothetical protein